MRSKQLKLAHILAGRNPVNDTWSSNQRRGMTSSKRVQDRSRYKRVNDLEAVTERCKIAHKVIYLLEVLKQEPEMVIPVKLLSADHRAKINLPKPHKISDFLRKSPKLFQLHRTRTGTLWCGLTELADELLREEETLLEAHSDKAAEIVARFLMMTLEKKLELGKIAHFRRDFGLPIDFRSEWVTKYPSLFRPCSSSAGVRSLELVGWDPRLAVTELERRTAKNITDPPGILRLGFPLKFPPNYLKAQKNKARIDEFQRMAYLSPYADARGLVLEPSSPEKRKASPELRKRAVAVIHELLSFTVEKRLATTDHLTHFRRELLLPPKLMKLLLKHYGVFYVSERGTRFGVYLTEAYRGSELIEKHPLLLWKERLHGFIGYRDRANKAVPGFGYLSDMETDGLGLVGGDHEELEVSEVCQEYEN